MPAMPAISLRFKATRSRVNARITVSPLARPPMASRRCGTDLLRFIGRQSISICEKWEDSSALSAKFDRDTGDPRPWVAQLNIDLVRKIRRNVAEVESTHRIALVQQIPAGQISGPASRFPPDLRVEQTIRLGSRLIRRK